MQTASTVATEIVQRIKSPLSMLRGRTENLRAQLEYLQREKAQGILDQIEQLEALVSSVEALVAPASSFEKNLEVAKLIEEFNSFYQFRMAKGKIQMLNIVPQDLNLKVCESDFKMILNCVLLNAVEALEESSAPSKCIFVQYQKAPNGHVLSVEDNGPGIADNLVNSLFKPFFSTKKGHLGMSLAICQQMAQKYGWTLQLISKEKQGVRFELWIPYSSGSGSP